MNLENVDNPDRLISALLDWIQQPRSIGETRNFVEALKKVAVENQAAIAVLSELLRSCEDEIDCCFIAAALGEIDSGNAQSIATLTQILQALWLNIARLQVVADLAGGTRPFFFIYFEWRMWRAADSLVRIDSTNEGAIATLIWLVQSSEGYEDEFQAALCTLRNIDPSHQLANRALIDRIARLSPNYWLYSALNYLDEIQDSEIVVSALAEAIHTAPFPHQQAAAAFGLGRIFPGDRSAIDTLINLLKSEEKQGWDYLHFARYLAEIGSQGEATITALIDFVQNSSVLGDSFNIQPIVNYFDRLSQENLMRVVSSLRSYLTLQDTRSFLDGDPFTTWDGFSRARVEGERVEICYQIIWNCAEKMIYSDFYQAWHSQF